MIRSPRFILEGTISKTRRRNKTLARVITLALLTGSAVPASAATLSGFVFKDTTPTNKSFDTAESKVGGYPLTIQADDAPEESIITESNGHFTFEFDETTNPTIYITNLNFPGWEQTTYTPSGTMAGMYTFDIDSPYDEVRIGLTKGKTITLENKQNVSSNIDNSVENTDSPLPVASPTDVPTDVEDTFKETESVESAPTDICKSVTSREEVANALQAGIEPEQISKAYADCLSPVEPPIFNEDGEPVQDVTKKMPWWGNTRFEELTGCGYHPQRRELMCVIKLKQQSGYGGTPPYPANNGSFEWVKFCVLYPNGWETVNTSAVHVHDKPSFAMYPPPYHYGVVIQANPKLHKALVNGQTLWARAALSWGALPPTQPWCPPGYWGNSKFLKIKLDP